MSLIAPPVHPSRRSITPDPIRSVPSAHRLASYPPPAVPLASYPPPAAPPPPPSTPPPPSRPPPPVAAGGRRWTPKRLRRLLATAGTLAIVAGALAMDRSGLVLVPLLFIMIVPFEKLFPRHRQRIRRPQAGLDVGYALASPLLQAAGIVAGVVVAVVSLAWLPGLLLAPVVATIPPAVTPFVGIVLFDLAIYWTHRWYHEVPFLWRFHAIHHSPRHMDWISGFRNHPLDGTLLAPAFVFLLAAGFSPEFTGVLAVVQIATGLFLHANVRWRLRWLHRLIITPEFHHWHHANETDALNTNYSVFLPAWDILFGTYFMPRHRRPQRYGVEEYIPDGMVAQLWHPLRGMGNPLRGLIHPIRSTRYLVRFMLGLLGDMKRSATRPRRPRGAALAPCPATPGSWPTQATITPPITPSVSAAWPG